jgi:hypothetical protein
MNEAAADGNLVRRYVIPGMATSHSERSGEARLRITFDNAKPRRWSSRSKGY